MLRDPVWFNPYEKDWGILLLYPYMDDALTSNNSPHQTPKSAPQEVHPKQRHSTARGTSYRWGHLVSLPQKPPGTQRCILVGPESVRYFFLLLCVIHAHLHSWKRGSATLSHVFQRLGFQKKVLPKNHSWNGSGLRIKEYDNMILWY